MAFLKKRCDFNFAWFARYALGGTATVAVEWTGYFLLKLFGVYYLKASVISNLVSYAVNYFISKYWVFRSPQTSHVRDIFLFVVCNGLNLIAVTALTYFMVGVILMHHVVGRVIASFLAFFIVMFFKRYIIWIDAEKY